MKLDKLVLIFGCIYFTFTLFSSEPFPGQVVGFYGSTDYNMDTYAYAMENGIGGGFIMVGEMLEMADERSRSDLIIVRVDSEGKLLWARQFGKEGQTDMAVGIAATDDGYLIVGQTFAVYCEGYLCYSASLILKIDDAGNFIWQKTYGKEEYLSAIRKTNDGNFIAVGGIVSKAPPLLEGLVMKIDKEGNVIWKKYIQTLGYNFYDAKVLENGDLLVYGFFSTFYRLDSEGNLVWAKKFDKSVGYLLEVTKANNGYLISSCYSLALPDYDLHPLIFYLGEDGEIKWGKKLPDLGDPYKNIAFMDRIYPKDANTFTVIGPFSYSLSDYESYGGVAIFDISLDGSIIGATVINHSVYEVGCWPNSIILGTDGNVGYCGRSFTCISDDIGLIKTGSGNKISGNCTTYNEYYPEWESFIPPSPNSVEAEVFTIEPLCFDVSTLNLTKESGFRGTNTFCPQIYQVKKMQNPFRLEVLGENFSITYFSQEDYDPVILIDGKPVPETKRDGHQRLIAKKGKSLKDMLPKGMPVCIQVGGMNKWTGKLNPLYQSDCFYFTR